MRIKKFPFIILIILLSFLYSVDIFSSDIILNVNYGINYIAKSDLILLLNITLQNRDYFEFNGKIKVNVYETETNIYTYEYDIYIPSNDILNKTIDVSISDKSNTLNIEIYDENNILITHEKLNVDLSSIERRLIIGIISDKSSNLNYFDNLPLKNGSIYTKIINIDINDIFLNRQVFEQIDCLLISGIDLSNDNVYISALNGLLENYINNNKIIILGTGSMGINSMSSYFKDYIIGPSYIENQILDFNGQWTNNINIYNNIDLPVSNYNIIIKILIFINIIMTIILAILE